MAESAESRAGQGPVAERGESPHRPQPLGTVRKQTVTSNMVAQEDDMVRRLVAEHGAKKWSFISSHLPGRIRKQCRERCDDAQASCRVAPRMFTR